MTSQQKTRLQKASRWLRMGTLALVTLGPTLSMLTTRLFARTEKDMRLRACEAACMQRYQQPSRLQSLGAHSQETLQNLGHTFKTNMRDLKANAQPYTEDLLRHGEHLIEKARGHGSDLSQQVSEQGSQFGHKLARQGAQWKQDMAQRGYDAARRLQRLTRSKQLEQKREEQKTRDFWISLGFGLGLTAAAIVTFRFIRQRMQQQEVEEYDSHFQLADPHALNGLGQDFSTPLPVSDRTRASTAGSIQQPTAYMNVPADALYIGVIRDRQYYSIETPLDQLALPGSDMVDVVYFTSESDARSQGFSAAR